MEKVVLSEVYKQQKSDRDIFQELMPFKVREILLVATPYDAFSIISDGRFFDQIVGEYLQLNLYSAPRITSVFSASDALNKLKYNNYSMVILMAGLDKKGPLELAQKIKTHTPDIPILLLVNNNSDLPYFKGAGDKSLYIDNVFVWNGDPKVFLAMTKLVEDTINLPNDTLLGDVRVILLIEDSVRYYTRYLPKLYALVMQQTQRILQEHSVDDLHKILKMRARPKIILCQTYEKALETFERYKNNLLCVISDVSFEKAGKIEPTAGIELLQYIKSQIAIPCLMQSSELNNADSAKKLEIQFISKDSETLEQELGDFLTEHCGFGDFIFKNARGIAIERARNIHEFEEKLATVPPESLIYHAKRQGISKWLMARGYISLAKLLSPVGIHDFKSTLELRTMILDTFEEVKINRLKGKVIAFDQEFVHNRHFILQIGRGSLGGKGRGIAFVSHLVENIQLDDLIPEQNIRIPSTTIVGSSVFEDFMESNRLYDVVFSSKEYSQLKKEFVRAQLPRKIIHQLRAYLEKSHHPLAIRSSGLFEDSLLQPFAGVYSTYLLSNNHDDIEVRLQQLTTAIKLVYCSIYSPEAQQYFSAVHYKIEEEKMAVLIQELVGEVNHNTYYPHISGVAQSYNYYPFAYMKPEDGFSVAALGLGKYTVGGEKSYRFCPAYPNLELLTINDQVKDSQNYFYALNLKNQCPDLLTEGEESNIVKLPLNEAEEDGNLKHIAQVFDYENQRLTSSFDKKGPRVVNFANILKYGYTPLAETISTLLDIFQQALGAPVEIEYAVDLSDTLFGKPTFYILQIKPLIKKEFQVEFDEEEIDASRALLYAQKGMGNGIIDNITDIIYYYPEKFDTTETLAMAQEIAQINAQMIEEDRCYILIGPGRWGTHDRFTGIPVLWSQISNAKVIIEMGLADFPLEASLGSHFFHNVTSMNVGYFAIPYKSSENYIQMDLLSDQQILKEYKYFSHVRLTQPTRIVMDGKQQKAVILLAEPDLPHQES